MFITNAARRPGSSCSPSLIPHGSTPRHTAFVVPDRPHAPGRQENTREDGSARYDTPRHRVRETSRVPARTASARKATGCRHGSALGHTRTPVAGRRGRRRPRAIETHSSTPRPTCRSASRSPVPGRDPPRSPTWPPRIEAARCLVYKAGWMIDRATTTPSSPPSRSASPPTAMKVTTDAVQVFGGYGYSKSTRSRSSCATPRCPDLRGHLPDPAADHGP